MILFRLVGGPFDGADGEGDWQTVPNVLWVRYDVDSPGRHKGVVNLRQRPGAVPYDLSGRRGDRNVYIFGEVSDEGYGELADQTLLPTAA